MISTHYRCVVCTYTDMTLAPLYTADLSNTSFFTPIPIPNISKDPNNTQYHYKFLEEALTIPHTNTDIHEGS